MTSDALNNMLKCNPFELFNINAQFEIDLAKIKNDYLELQKKYHPDNFQGNEEKKSILLMLSSHINDSYTILKNPLFRSIKLLELLGNPLNLSTDTSLPTNFLISQMELHEEIEDAISQNSIEILEQIETQIEEYEAQTTKQIAQAFEQKDLEKVKTNTKQLAFYNKVKTTLNSTISNLI